MRNENHWLTAILLLAMVIIINNCHANQESKKDEIHIAMVFASRSSFSVHYHGFDRREEIIIAIQSILRMSQNCNPSFHLFSTPTDVDYIKTVVDLSHFKLFDFVNIEDITPETLHQWFGSFYSNIRTDGRQDAFFKLTIEKLLPNVERVLVLDIDVLVVEDLCEMWRDIFYNKIEKQKNVLFGIAPDVLTKETAPFFLPKNTLGLLAPTQSIFQDRKEVLRGINSGVLFLHLERMRQVDWNTVWRNELVEWIQSTPVIMTMTTTTTTTMISGDIDVYDENVQTEFIIGKNGKKMQIEIGGTNLQKAWKMRVELMDQGIFNLVTRQHPEYVVELDISYNFNIYLFFFHTEELQCETFRHLVCSSNNKIKIWHAAATIFHKMDYSVPFQPFKKYYWKSENPTQEWLRRWQMCDNRLAIVFYGMQNDFERGYPLFQNSYLTCDVNVFFATENITTTPKKPPGKVQTFYWKVDTNSKNKCSLKKLDEINTIKKIAVQPDAIDLLNLDVWNINADHLLLVSAKHVNQMPVSSFDLCFFVRQALAFLQNGRVAWMRQKPFFGLTKQQNAENIWDAKIMFVDLQTIRNSDFVDRWLDVKDILLLENAQGKNVSFDLLVNKFIENNPLRISELDSSFKQYMMQEDMQ